MRNTFLIILISLLTSCSYRLTRNYQTPDSQQLASDCKPVLLKKKNLLGLNAKYLGSIRLDDSGFSVNCSEVTAIKKLNQEACLLKSNLINITDEAHFGASTCYRCIADFYYLEFDSITNRILNSKERIKLQYNQAKKIKWSDFRMYLPENSSVPYDFVSTIELESGGASFWTGELKNFKAQGVFYCDASKVKRSFAVEINLNHIGGLYDLTQIYAKKLEQFLNSNGNSSNNISVIQKTVDRYAKDLSIEQNKYIVETEYGSNNIAQQSWSDKIKLELKNLNINQ